MARSTHSGHCQVCGKLHKLPNGVLSKHGYTVEWNTFWNECWGECKLPFEQDITYTKKAIEDVKLQKARLENEVAEILALTEFAYVIETTPREFRKPSVRTLVKIPKADLTWEDGYKDGNDKYRWGLYWIGEDGNEYKEENLYGVNNLEDAIKKVNANHARTIQYKVDQAGRYIDWQEKRIEGWKPSPLIPHEVKKVAKKTWFKWEDRGKAYAEEKRIKATGAKAMVRRDSNYGNGFTLFDYS
jgi:hypothetical protein